MQQNSSALWWVCVRGYNLVSSAQTKEPQPQQPHWFTTHTNDNNKNP